MKWPPLPVFSLLLMFVVAVTLSFRVYLCRHFDLMGGDGGIAVGMTTRKGPQLPTAFDPMLLRLASNYTSDAKFGAEIERLLEGNFSREAQIRTFATWRRIVDHRKVDRWASFSSMNDPRFYRYRLDYRRNLHDWSRKRRFDREVMLGLVELVKLTLDEHVRKGGGDISDRKYKSCA